MSVITVNKAALAKVREAFEGKQLWRQFFGGGVAKYGGTNPCAIGVMMDEATRIKADNNEYGSYTLRGILHQWSEEELGDFFTFEGVTAEHATPVWLSSKLVALQNNHDSGTPGWEDGFNTILTELEAAFA